MTAIDLLLHAASDDKPKRFLHASRLSLVAVVGRHMVPASSQGAR